MMWLAGILKDDVLCRKLEVDLYQLGVDLVGFYKGEVSVRRMVTFAKEVESDSSSRLQKELISRHNYDEGSWNEDTSLLAYIANVTASLHYQQSMDAWGKSDKKQDKPIAPKLIKPPGWREPKKVMSPTEDVVSMFGGAQYSPT